MRPIYFAIAVLLAWVMPVQAGPQGKRLMSSYEHAGETLVRALYWLPETRDTVRKHIPGHDQWVGFEVGQWNLLAAEEQGKVLKAVGEKLDGMTAKELNATWERVWAWDPIRTQIGLCSNFYGDGESFLQMAYEDPVLRPAYQWIIDRRGAKFDTRHVGATLATGETAYFYPLLILLLLDTPEQQRYECFSRLLAEAARAKAPQSKPGE